MTRWIPLLGLALAACSHDDKPALAFDPIWLEPRGDGIHGFETWQVYSAKWASHFREKFYVCSVVVEIEGDPVAPDDGCTGCTTAWATTVSLTESDCGDALTADPGFLSLSRIALGDVPSTLSEDNPYPAKAMGGWVDYATGDWEPHGWAYPDALDAGTEPESTDWDGTQPFEFWPAFYWDLADAR